MSFIGDIFSGDKGAGYTGSYAPISTPFLTPEKESPINKFIADTYKGQGNVNAQQAQLAQMLLAQAQGTGPNPAAAALQQATNANQSMTAGNIAATKGINPALAARQAAMAGAGIQQQSAAQGAQMKAGQQLAAQQQLGGLYGQQAGQNLTQQQLLFNAQSALNNANVANQGQRSQAESGVAQQNAKTQGGILSGVTGGIGHAFGLAHGGQVPSSGPSSKIGQFLHKAMGGNVGDMKAGGKVPGKPEVQGDSLKNDKVAAKLSPGEIVLPRSVTTAKDAPQKAAAFVQAVLAKSSMPKGK